MLRELPPDELERLAVEHAVLLRLDRHHRRVIQHADQVIVRVVQDAQLLQHRRPSGVSVYRETVYSHLHLHPLHRRGAPNHQIEVFVAGGEEEVEIGSRELLNPLGRGAQIEDRVVDVDDEQLLPRSRRIENPNLHRIQSLLELLLHYEALRERCPGGKGNRPSGRSWTLIESSSLASMSKSSFTSGAASASFTVWSITASGVLSRYLSEISIV